MDPLPDLRSKIWKGIFADSPPTPKNLFSRIGRAFLVPWHSLYLITEGIKKFQDQWEHFWEPNIDHIDQLNHKSSFSRPMGAFLVT
jgi:hypothetical protein